MPQKVERYGYLVMQPTGAAVATYTPLGPVYEVYVSREDAIRVAAAMGRVVMRVQLSGELEDAE